MQEWFFKRYQVWGYILNFDVWLVFEICRQIWIIFFRERYQMRYFQGLGGSWVEGKGF